MKIILLVLCAAAALSSSESYILRPQPVNVYYGVPRFQRGKSSTEYGRFTVIINKNPKTEEELKSLPDSRAVLDWAMKNGQYITENEIFKDKPQMLTFINGEKAKNRVFYTPGLNLRERLRRRRRQILEHKYPTAHEMVLSRSQRAVPFLLPIFGVFGSITLFLAIYLPYQSDHSYLYNNNGLVNAGYLLTHEEERTRDITPAEMHLIEIINDNSKFEKQFIDGLSFDYFAFNRMHRAQLIQAAKEDKEKERAATKDAQNKQSDVSYYWHFNSNSGQGHFLNGVVNSHGNQPPTTPRPTPPTRRTPAPKLDLGNQKNRKRPAAAEVITLDDSDEQLDDTITLGDSDDEQNKSVVYIGNSDDSEIEILSPGVTPTDLLDYHMALHRHLLTSMTIRFQDLPLEITILFGHLLLRLLLSLYLGVYRNNLTNKYRNITEHAFQQQPSYQDQDWVQHRQEQVLSGRRRSLLLPEEEFKHRMFLD